MADSLALAIRERVIAFLAGEFSLPDFQDWLVGATWDVDDRIDPIAHDLTYEVKLAVAEYSRGDISQGELRARFGSLVETTAGAANVRGGSP